MERKIVQIAISDVDPGPGYLAERTVALCNDGTVWESKYTGQEPAAWNQLPPIPQVSPPDSRLFDLAQKVVFEGLSKGFLVPSDALRQSLIALRDAIAQGGG